MEENNLEEKEILTTEMKAKYIVYDHSTGEAKSYTANNSTGRRDAIVAQFTRKILVNFGFFPSNFGKTEHFH